MIYQYSDVLSTLSVCLLQGDNLGESRAGRFSLLLHLNELLYLMRRSRKKQLCVVTSPEWSSVMSIAAVSSSSTLCSSSSDIKEDLVGEAMFLLLCVWGICLGAFFGGKFFGGIYGAIHYRRKHLYSFTTYRNRRKIAVGAGDYHNAASINSSSLLTNDGD